MSLCVDLLLLDSLVYIHMKSYSLKSTNSKNFNLHYTSSQSGNERWQLMSKLVPFTDVHIPGLNPSSYDNLNNMKLDLNVSTRSNQGL